jgi:hypothetical protein
MGRPEDTKKAASGLAALPGGYDGGGAIVSVSSQLGNGTSAGALRNDTTPGISQFSHISSTFAWK